MATIKQGSTLKVTAETPVGLTTILHDDCSGTAGGINGRTPTPTQPGSSTWTVEVGTASNMQVNGSGKMTCYGVTVGRIDTTIATGTYSAKIAANPVFSFYVRGGPLVNQDFFRSVVRTVNNLDQVVIQKRTGGGSVLTVSGSQQDSVGIPNNVEILHTVTITSTTMRFEIDGYYDHTVTDSDHNTNTNIGLANLISTTTSTFDDIKAEQ